MRALILMLILGSLLPADDVTLKNGQVHKNLTLVKEMPKQFQYETLDGRVLTFMKDAVQDRVVAATPLDEFRKRRTALPAGDVPAMVALATWGQEQGVTKETKKLWDAALKADPENAAARAALGFHKLEGKWLNESDYAKARDASLEAGWKLRGWRKVKDKWMRPVDAFRAEKSLVEVQGQWITAAQQKKIESEKLFWSIYGNWVSADDKKQLDAGLLKEKGKWVPAANLDAAHGDQKNPWTLSTGTVVLNTNVRHERALKILSMADDIYSGLIKVGGVHPDSNGKWMPLLLLIGRGIKSYQGMGAAFGASDREANHSSGYGAFMSSKGLGDFGGLGITYDNDDDDWTRVWVGHALGHAYLDRFKPEDTHDERLTEAFAGYASALHGGSWQPTWWYWCRWLKDGPIPDASRILEAASYRDDKTLAWAGMLLHWLSKKNETAFGEFWEMFGMGRGNTADLLKACCSVDGKWDAKAMDEEFQAWVTKLRTNFRPWDK